MGRIMKPSKMSMMALKPIKSVGLRAFSTSVVTSKPQKLNLSNVDPPEKIRQSWFAATFPVEKLTHLLDHDNHEMRQKFRQFISEPVMIPRYNISLAEEREWLYVDFKGFVTMTSFRSWISGTIH